jgi:hypothetical protein
VCGKDTKEVSMIPKRGPKLFMRISKRKFASRKRNIAGLCAFVLAGVVAMGAYAFTASNTVPAQSAGGGQAVVSGYTESGVSYTWNAPGTKITAAHFILKSAAKLEPSDVKVALTEGAPKEASEWVDCPKAKYVVKGEEETEIVCEFGAGIENKVGTQLTVAAVSEGTVVVE